MKLLRNYAKKNYLASSFLIYLIGTFFLKGISIFTTPVFTRVLSVEGFGIASIFRVWVNFFAVFIGLQVSGSIATARIHLEAKHFEGYMRNITLLSLVGAVTIGVIGFLFRFALSSIIQVDVKLLPHLFLQAYGVACASLYSTYTIQVKKPKQNVVFSIVISVINIVLSLTFVLSFSHEKFLGKIYGPTFIYVLVIIFVLNKFTIGKKSVVNSGTSLSDWKYALLLSTPLIIHLLSNIVVGQSDRIFLAKLLNEEAAAIYSVAYSVGTLGMMVAEVSNKVWSPWYLDNTKVSNHKIINRVVQKYILLMSFVFVGVMLIAPEIIMIMAPKEYSSGVSSLIIITASVFFQFLYRFPLAYEQYSRNLRWVAFSTVTSALINIGLNYTLINALGLIGAALATFISYVILFTMHEFAARIVISDYNIKFKSYIGGITTCIIFGVIAYFTIDYWMIRYGIILIGTIIFILYIFVSKDNKYERGI
ncbi:MAG: lipopolysaccharide biosynthesis protein [Mammaliicoccus vitulinus]